MTAHCRMVWDNWSRKALHSSLDLSSALRTLSTFSQGRTLMRRSMSANGPGKLRLANWVSYYNAGGATGAAGPALACCTWGAGGGLARVAELLQQICRIDDATDLM
jgi:hypothetical protein